MTCPEKERIFFFHLIACVLYPRVYIKQILFSCSCNLAYICIYNIERVLCVPVRMVVALSCES